MPDLASRVRIAYNPRLRSTIGRALLDERHVELNTRLLRRHPGELVSTLVHELAHIAVSMRYGQVAPHGRQFQTLMQVVDISSKATHTLPVRHLRRRVGSYIYLHRCSDCGYSFIARSIRRNYYCLACGPDMSWDIFRATNNANGKAWLKLLRKQFAGKS